MNSSSGSVPTVSTEKRAQFFTVFRPVNHQIESPKPEWKSQNTQWLVGEGRRQACLNNDDKYRNMDHETIAMIPQTSEDRITLERAMDVLGLSESNVLAFTRSCPPMLNPYPGNDGILVSQREVQALRIALLAELEAYFAAHPGHLVRLLGSQPFIDAYHVENRKTRQSSTHAA